MGIEFEKKILNLFLIITILIPIIILSISLISAGWKWDPIQGYISDGKTTSSDAQGYALTREQIYQVIVSNGDYQKTSEGKTITLNKGGKISIKGNEYNVKTDGSDKAKFVFNNKAELTDGTKFVADDNTKYRLKGYDVPLVKGTEVLFKDGKIILKVPENGEVKSPEKIDKNAEEIKLEYTSDKDAGFVISDGNNKYKIGKGKGQDSVVVGFDGKLGKFYVDRAKIDSLDVGGADTSPRKTYLFFDGERHDDFTEPYLSLGNENNKYKISVGSPKGKVSASVEFLEGNKYGGVEIKTGGVSKTIGTLTYEKKENYKTSVVNYNIKDNGQAVGLMAVLNSGKDGSDRYNYLVQNNNGKIIGIFATEAEAKAAFETSYKGSLIQGKDDKFIIQARGGSITIEDRKTENKIPKVTTRGNFYLVAGNQLARYEDGLKGVSLHDKVKIKGTQLTGFTSSPMELESLDTGGNRIVKKWDFYITDEKIDVAPAGNSDKLAVIGRKGTPVSSRLEFYQLSKDERAKFAGLDANTQKKLISLGSAEKMKSELGKIKAGDLQLIPSKGTLNIEKDNKGSNTQTNWGKYNDLISLAQKDTSYGSVYDSEKHKAVVVKLGANGRCGPCRTMDSAIQSLVSQGKYSDVKFVKVDEATNPELFNKYSVGNIPELVFLKDGQVVGRSVGMTGKMNSGSLERVVKQNLKF